MPPPNNFYTPSLLRWPKCCFFFASFQPSYLTTTLPSSFFHILPSGSFLLPTKGIDSSDGGEYLLSYSTGRGVLLLLLTGEGSCQLGKHSPRDGQQWREGNKKESKLVIFSKTNNKTSDEGRNQLDENGQLVSNSSSNLVDIAVWCLKRNLVLIQSLCL